MKKVEYIEITKKRYDYVKTKYKYMTSSFRGERRYYLAKNRARLDDKITEEL